MTSQADDAAGAEPAIVFIGPMGAGKTSVGKRVARRLGRTFTDTDKAVAAVHGPIPAIFADKGEAHFRTLERRAVQDALTQGGVVALGGGAVLDPDTQRDLARHRVVLLTVEPRTVRGRLSKGTRPLLTGEDPMERWTRIAQERRPVYEAVADVVFDTSRGPLQDIVDAVATWAEADAGPEEEHA